MRKDLFTLGFVVAVISIASGLAAAVPAQAAGPFQYFAVTPCRVVDSRTTNATEGTNSTPLANGPHQFRIQGQCGVPNGAAAATMNFTIVNPNQVGYLLIFPTNVSQPTVSTLNFLAGEPALANGAIVPLAPVSMATDKDLAVRISMVAPGQSDIVVDVTGYFQ
jgi:hypothetical protein